MSEFPTVLVAIGASISTALILVAAVCEDLFHGVLLFLVLLFVFSLIFI